MKADEKVNILMVDDQPAKLLSYEVILGELGENLIKATSASEALNVLLKTDIGVVLMDVSMPELDGFELADVIRQHPRFQKTAIIFISGVHLTDSDKIQGYRSGAVDYISVPVVPEVLRAKISIFVDLHRKTRMLERLNSVLEQRVEERTEELRQSEAQFRTLSNTIPQLAWVAHPDGSIFWYNQRWYDFTGLSPERSRPEDWTQVQHPDFVARVELQRQQARAAGSLWEETVPMRGKDGDYCWFLARSVPLLNPQGQIVRWFGTATDISAQISAEEKIRMLNRQLQQRVTELETIMQVLPVGIAIADIGEGRQMVGNAAYNQLFALPDGPHALADKSGYGGYDGRFYNAGRLMEPEELPLQQAVFAGRLVEGTEFQVRLPSGQVKYVLASASPLFEDSGEVGGAVGAFFDVTDRRNLEDKLRERADLLELASEAIMVRDMEGKVLFWNSGAQNLYGWGRDEFIGQNIHEVLCTVFPTSEEDAESVLRGMRSWQGNLIQRTRDGDEVVVASRMAVNREGNAVLEINRDITAQVKAEDVLRETEKLAAMGRVAGIIAHEINNPLAAITNTFYLLRHHPSLDEEARAYANMAEQELDRVCHITKQALSFYRESRLPIPVHLPELLDDVLKFQERGMQNNQVVLRKKYFSACVVQGFPVELRQVFMNLIGNALQAMPEGGVLQLQVREATDWVTRRRGAVISILDTGQGIQPEDAKRLFQPFFSTKSTKGTGLGLWMSKGIVQKYEGRISFRSCRGQDGYVTCFRVFLPVSGTLNNITPPGSIGESAKTSSIPTANGVQNSHGQPWRPSNPDGHTRPTLMSS